MRWRRLRSGPTAAIIGTAVAGLFLLACSPPPPPGDPPPQPAATTTRDSSTTEVAIGVDELSAGFNPHTLADLSPTTTALSGLLLPSAFQQDSDGSWQLDRILLLSAEQTSDKPFTITYRLRSDAAWSDTAPIAAEDFVYLAEHMRTQPGVVDPAGYQLIDQVRSRDGGKTVEVVFRQPYPGWRTLFNDLLPAHLLKDAPGGWADALDDGIPVSGGPYAIRSRDPARGQLVLERNDRYWAKPAVLDRVVLREGDDTALAETLRSGNQQIAMLTTPDAIGVSTFAALGDDVARLVTVPRPVVASVLLRPASGRLADDVVRQAVAAALDRDALIATGTASGPSTRLRADAHVLAPSQPRYLPTIPQSGHSIASGPAVVARLLSDAGYRRDSSGWTRDGEPLRLVVAAPDERYPYVTLAQRVADQLADVGIPTELVTPEGDVLFGTLLDDGPRRATPEQAAGEAGTEVDIAVVPQPVGGDPATVLASRYGCPPVVPPGQPQPPPNPAGFCDLSMQPFIEGALSGSIPLADALAVVEPALWRQVPAVPLFQEAALLATTAEVSGVAPGGLLAGPFADLARWRRPRR